MFDPEEEFVNTETGMKFVPNEEPQIITDDEEDEEFAENPDWDEWGKPNYAKLFVGLSMQIGHAQPYPVVNPELIRAAVRGVRMNQVGREYGSTFISQTGDWVDPDTGDVVEEDSLQIIFYPGGSEFDNWDEFKANIREVAEFLLHTALQKSIIFEFTRDGEGELVGAVSLSPEEIEEIESEMAK